MTDRSGMNRLLDELTDSGWGMWIGGFLCGAGTMLLLLGVVIWR